MGKELQSMANILVNNQMDADDAIHAIRKFIKGINAFLLLYKDKLD